MAQKNWLDEQSSIVPATNADTSWLDSGSKIIAPEKESPGLIRKAGDLGLSVAKGVVSVPEAAVGIADIPTGGRIGKFLGNEGGALGFRPKQAKEYLSSLQSDDLQNKQKQFQQADGVLDKAGVALSNPSLVANAVAESVPLMGAGAVPARALLAVAPRVGAAAAGAIGEGVVGAGSAAEAIRQETPDGLLTPTQSGLAAATGATTSAFGFAGGKVAQRLGIGDVDTMFAQGAARAAGAPSAKSIPRQVVEGAIAEGWLEELPQSVSEQVLQNLALNKPWHEGVEDSAVLGTLAGMAMGGTAAGVSGFSQRGDTQGEQTPPPETPPTQPQDSGPTLALPAPDRGVIQVAGDGTARTPAYQAPGYVGDVTDVEPRAVNPVREQVAAAAEQGGALSSAALTAIDTGLSDAMQPAPEQAPPQISLEEADARDQAAYEQFFASHDSDPVVSRYFENDDDIPDFDAASNASEEDFLRALGATEEDIQDAIATSSQSAISQSSAAGNAGPQAYEPAGPREGAGEGAASQTGQVNAGAIQQAATYAPVPGVGGPVGADGAGSAATAVSGASGPGGAGAGAATGSGAGATEVGSARAGGRGDSNQALSAPTNLRDALERVRQQKQEAANAQAAQAPAPAAAPVPGPAAAPAVEAAGPALNIKAITAKQIPDMTDAELQAAIEHYGPAHKRTAKLQKEAQRRAAPATTTPTTTQGNADGPQASQAQQASPKPTQAAAAPAAAAGLTDGAPTANTGAQAAPAPGPQAATAAEPEFTTIKTVYGDSVTVRTADLNSDKPRLRQYTKDGKSKAVPAIHRDNLDLTGDKRKASAKEDADNPFFNVITTKDGSTFASQAAASRELNRLAMGETHEVVAASEVQDGAQGFVIRRKRADAMGSRAETGANQVATPTQQAQAATENVAGNSAGRDDGVSPRVPRENRAPAKPIEQGEQKEPWQMTAMEFGQQERGNPHWNQSYAGKDDGAYLADVQATHARLVQEAIDAGKLITEPAAQQTPQDGSKSYSDGQQLGADDLLAYFDRVIAGSQKGEKIVNPRFQIGAVDAETAQEIANYIDGYDGQQRNLRVSGRTLKHIHESRPSIAREIVGQLPGMFSKPDEVLPDPKHKNKRALLVKERQAEEGQSKPKSYVATVEVEIEIEVKDGFIDIVTIMTAPERSLKEARELKKNWPEGQQRTEQAVNSPHPLTAEAANPAADSPDARPAGISVPPTDTAAQPEAPKLTPAEAKSLMEWQDLGQKDGVKTHALTFYESQADKDAKRGRMIVAKVSKEVDSGNWTVEGTGEKLAVLGMAKKKAEQVGMEKAVADGFVEAAAAAPADATPEPAKPIEDAGEKIGGARKDRWKERGLNLDDLDAMTEAEGAELATKANVWKPDYEALAAQSEPVSAAMTKVIYDRLAAKPKKNTPEGRRQYVQMMRIVRDVLTEAKGPDAVRNAYLEIRKRAGLNAADPAAKSAGREMLFSVYKGRSDPFVLDGGDLMKVKKMVTDGFPAKGDPWKTRLTVGRAEGGAGTTERGIEIYMERSAEVGTPLTREQILDGFYRVSTKDNKTVAFAASKADAEAAAATVYERDMKGKKDGKPEPVRPNLDELKRENLPQRIDRDVTSEDFVRDLGFRGVEFGLWSAQDERQRILNMAYDGLMDLAEIMGVPPKAMSLNGTLGMAFGARGGGRFAAHYEPGKLVINMTKIRGGGSMAHEWSHAMDHYFGELDKPDAYTTQARGASGWYTEDQYNGVPRRRMERVGNEWKNVEKMRLDNLRPEMAAAFDEVMRALFQKQITKAEMVRSQELDLERTEALARSEQDAEMKAMYQNMVQNKREALNELRNDPEGKLYAGRGRSDYAQQAQALSGKSVDGYWVRPTEMFARAFESWVFDRVTAMGARSDYLVHGVEEDRFAGGGYKGNPYPTGEERARINAAFDKLASTIKTKETDKGVAMFSRAPSAIPPADSNARNVATQMLVDGLKAKWTRAPEIIVARNMQDAQIPQAVRDYDLELKSQGATGEARGFIYKGKVYLLSDELKGPQQIAEVLFHEVLGHYGLRGAFGDSLNSILQQMGTMRRRDVVAKAREYGLFDKDALGGLDKAAASDAQIWAAMSPKDRLSAAEEVLAEMAQTQPSIGFVQRAIAAIRNWLRANVPGFKSLRLTDADIIQAYILPARGFVTRSKETGAQSLERAMAAFSRDTNTAMTNNDVVGNQGGRSADDTTPGAMFDAQAAFEKHGGIGDVDESTDITAKSLAFAEMAESQGWTVVGRGDKYVTLKKHFGLDGEGYPKNAVIKARISDHSNVNRGVHFGEIDINIAPDDGYGRDTFEDALRKIRSAYVTDDLETVIPNESTASDGSDAPMFSRTPGDQTQTDAFKRWFKGSKVVDAEGNPLVVYHGTNSDLSAFASDRANYFTADPGAASVYAEGFGAPREGANVSPVYLSIQRPKWMPLTDSAKLTAADLAAIKEEGFDGVFGWTLDTGMGGPTPIAREVGTGQRGMDKIVTEAIPLSPEQIKSAISNNGNFDPEDDRINFSRAGMADLASKARDELNRTFTAPGKLSWWHKTVGTMYNLAERSPAFKRVFEAAQGFVDDVSYYATDAAEQAPRLLPKLETWRDIAKRPITAADNAAVAKPVFEGTLVWTRDEAGKPVRVDDLVAAAEKLTAEEKARRLLRQDKISAGMLRAWQGLPLEQYEKLVESRYESQMLKAGIVWTPAELKSMFKLTDDQVALYKEFRAATDRSLDTMARSDMLRYGGKDVADLRDMVMDAADAQDAAQILRDHLQMLAKENPERAGELGQLSSGMLDRAAKVQELQEQGYAPLSRFGKYTVDVVDANGERQYFGLFETQREANIMAMKMRKGFGQDAVSQGTLSNEEFKLLAGITPESLELFGNMLGLDSTGDDAQDQAFQEYLRRTKTNRSAMRRLIHRQGIAGYSEDVGRVLASFIYSNARQTSAGLHMGELGEAVTAIPKQQGELKDAAVQLSEYVKNPQEEAQAIRGLLFAQYLGGSIASAVVNMSQPAAVTFPWLSQFGGAKQAAAELGRAAKNLANKAHRYEADLAAALKHAEEEGTVSPQEVHQLMAQARGSGSLRPGDGTRVGEARAAAGNALTRLSLAWGKVFGAAEQVNRRMTYIAAFRIAKAQKMDNPAAFAKKAVIETQFTYSKANKMKWGRGAVGATVMTFKTYSVAYLELLGRMWSQGGPEGKRAVLLALGMLMLMGGAGGLPFAEDAEDLVDGLAQLAGYNFNSKKAKQELLESLFGEAGAGFVERGITGLPGMPLDVSGRLGMGNLLPGTGIFKEKTDHTRDVLEVVGPVGDLAKRAASGARSILAGDVGAGLLQIAPAAVRNAAKGADMAATGMYRDDKGYKVLDTSPAEAAMKAIGFQPASVAKVQEANFINQQAKNFYNMKAQEIRAKWARGIFEKDQGIVAEARADLEEWNRKNPEQRIVVSMPAVLKRVREMGKSKDERIAATAPKAMRQQMLEEAAKARATL